MIPVIHTMKKNALLLLIILTSCAPALNYEVKSGYDDFEKVSYVYELNNSVPLDVNSINATLNLGLAVIGEADKRILVNASFTADDWLFIQKEKSLLYLINGEVYSLDLIEYSNEVFNNAQVFEHGVYVIEKPLLDLIISSPSVKFRIRGDDRILEGSLTEENRQRYANFINRYY